MWMCISIWCYFWSLSCCSFPYLVSHLFRLHIDRVCSPELYAYLSPSGAKSLFIITHGGKNWDIQTIKFLDQMLCAETGTAPGEPRYFEVIKHLLTEHMHEYVISARHLFGARYPRNIEMWKISAFGSSLLCPLGTSLR